MENCIHGKVREKDECSVCPSMPTAAIRVANALAELRRAWNPALRELVNNEGLPTRPQVEDMEGEFARFSDFLADAAVGDLTGRVRFYEQPHAGGLRYVVVDDGMAYWLEEHKLCSAPIWGEGGKRPNCPDWEVGGEVDYDCVDTLDAGECRMVHQLLEEFNETGVVPDAGYGVKLVGDVAPPDETLYCENCGANVGHDPAPVCSACGFDNGGGVA